MTTTNDSTEHSHDLRLVTMHFDEGVTAREFECSTCGWVWFEAASRDG